MKKMKVLTIAITLIFSFIGVFLFQTEASAKNTSIHAHLRGDTSQVQSVAVIHKGDTIQLERKSEKLYSVKKPAEIVKPDVSDVLVSLTDGTVLTFSPAINYAGTEGKGTINYWVEIKVSEETTTEPDDETKEEDTSKDKETENTGSDTGEDTKSSNDKTNDHSSDKKSNDDNTATEVTETISGGKLPETATPWYNILLASALGLLTSGFVLYRVAKQD